MNIENLRINKSIDEQWASDVKSQQSTANTSAKQQVEASAMKSEGQKEHARHAATSSFKRLISMLDFVFNWLSEKAVTAGVSVMPVRGQKESNQ